ncbi:hypothetical protein KIN20_001323 [Parelaphostrongylus tenuis]|uniref:Chromatin target of PRMT1 protein C-terminal domain-containing protein n=1 Tax=Parelaphostrongylus tenuis TaxID=148309 RepID=A0AAD5LTY0_PARTN|nr:hypothetical protein KIN20_001323 [Parelaphostrongylus tenuis]
MTDTEMVEGVPTKIVMVGTSTMSLHQRFSRLQKPKLSAAKQLADRPAVRGVARGRTRGGVSVSTRRAAVLRSEPIVKVPNGSRLTVGSGRRAKNKVYEVLEPAAPDFVEEYVPVAPPQVRRVRPPLVYRRPIEERVTLPPAPEVVYVPVPVVTNQRKGRGSRGRGLQRNQGQKNNVRGVNNRGYFKRRSSAGRGGRAANNGRRGGKTAQAGHYPPLEKKTVSQLDRELEEYMRKSKHPKIVI